MSFAVSAQSHFSIKPLQRNQFKNSSPHRTFFCSSCFKSRPDSSYLRSKELLTLCGPKPRFVPRHRKNFQVRSTCFIGFFDCFSKCLIWFFKFWFMMDWVGGSWEGRRVGWRQWTSSWFACFWCTRVLFLVFCYTPVRIVIPFQSLELSL